MKQKQKTKLVWGKLKSFLLKNEPYIPLNNLHLNLFERTEIDQSDKTQAIKISEVLNYKIQSQDKILQVQNIHEINEINNKIIDNTGTLFWPAEEVLSFFVVNNTQLFHNVTTLIELGSGRSGLAAISLGLIRGEGSQIQDIILTDGNLTAIEQLNHHIKLNEEIFVKKGYKVEIDSNFQDQDSFRSSQQLTLKTGVLCWQQEFSQKNMYTGLIAILISDCVFFENFHLHLIATIQFLLDNGVGRSNNFCLMACPTRGHSLENLKALISQSHLKIQSISFDNAVYRKEVEAIKKLKEYEDDRHDIYFYKIQLK